GRSKPLSSTQRKQPSIQHFRTLLQSRPYAISVSLFDTSGKSSSRASNFRRSFMQSIHLAWKVDTNSTKIPTQFQTLDPLEPDSLEGQFPPILKDLGLVCLSVESISKKHKFRPLPTRKDSVQSTTLNEGSTSSL